MKVALVCPGIGESQRGYERFCSDLFRLLKDDLDITLFKGGGARSEQERVPIFIRRNGRLARYLPVHKLFGKTSYHSEGLTYSLALWRNLQREPYDIVHTIDPPLARMMYRLRTTFGGSYRLIFTNGACLTPEVYPGAEHVHHVGLSAYEDALASGYPETRISLHPSGIDVSRFRPGDDRAALRRKHGVDEKTFVILSVSSINRRQKRLEYLIEEVARLDGDLLLWIDGGMELADSDPSLLDLGRQRLGARCRFSHVASDQVPELYRLADVKVVASTEEAVPLVAVEAMASNLPVLAHDNPHFHWLLTNRDLLVNMKESGALSRRLHELMNDRGQLRRLADPESFRRRFDWMALKQEYLSMYRDVASMKR